MKRYCIPVWLVDPAVMRASLDCIRMGKRFLVTAFAHIVIVIETCTVFVIGALDLAFCNRPLVKGFAL